MGLLDDIKAEVQMDGKRPIPCPTCDAVRAAAPAEQEALRDAVAGMLSERAVLRLSKKHGLGIGRKSLIRHREEGHAP